jgi:hypothetical protein
VSLPANPRVLCVEPGPQFSVQDVHYGWVAGLQQVGCQVVPFNLNDRLTFYNAAHMPDGNDGWKKALEPDQAQQLVAKGIEAVCYEWWPHIVVVTFGKYVTPQTFEIMRARNHKVVLLCTESPYEDNVQFEMAAYADVVLLNDPTNLETFRRKANPRTFYAPHAYNPQVHRPGRPDPDLVCDFAFVGTGFPSREAFFEAVDWSGINVALAGNWENLTAGSPLHKLLLDEPDQCIDNADTVKLYRSCKVSANLYRREGADGVGHGWAMGPREVELAATGTFFLRDPRGEGDEVLSMLPTFDGPGDFEEQLRFWLNPNRDAARGQAAGRARAAVAERTFANHARQLLSLLDREGSSDGR